MKSIKLEYFNQQNHYSDNFVPMIQCKRNDVAHLIYIGIYNVDEAILVHISYFVWIIKIEWYLCRFDGIKNSNQIYMVSIFRSDSFWNKCFNW